MPPQGRAALRAGVIGNWIDNIHVFLPLTALAPAMAVVAGPSAGASVGALVVIAMLLGRPLGGMIFGRISDRLGRTRTTRLAIAGTATCAGLIAVMPTHELIGAWTIGLILVLRFLGGIFVAGEYSAAIPLAMEWSSPKKRGLASGVILSMAPWAQASIAFAVAVALAALGPDRYAAWGWRVLFVIGAAMSVGMIVYYSRCVYDAPLFHRANTTREAWRTPTPGVREVVAGRWASAFWQVFTLMTGLWLLTDTTVLILTARLRTDAGLTATATSWVMGVASVGQAVFMALAGHWSTRVGRRRLLVCWGVSATVLGPLLWWGAMRSTSAGVAALFALALQVATVSAYGPVSAYLSERFPTEVRSTGYGMGYSLSLILPALYPFYLPGLETVFGRLGAVLVLVILGGMLVVLGAALGPRLSASDIDADIDDVARVA
ncbi:MHS family MFS transporter [Cutibacterium sp. WCA-380-WT-3A]|uniref:MHS family MFS transporter n=2 Tax=Cutibacterium porci TaxID=2605781 RepID=A0A7K0J4B2_9ACTN|nr:MHS family MFS transporter [Cutibacterium porci]